MAELRLFRHCAKEVARSPSLDGSSLGHWRTVSGSDNDPNARSDTARGVAPRRKHQRNRKRGERNSPMLNLRAIP
jgi:hypothetical protein